MRPTATAIPANPVRYRLRTRQTDETVRRLPWYVTFFLTYMAAITIIGKGPTYLGIPPLYWGEMTMALDLLLIAPWIKLTDYIHQKAVLTAEIVVFLAMGAVETAFSFPRWGLDAIRDAALWYYAVFFFIGIGLASRKAIADRVWYVFRIIWIFALLWNTADTLSGHKLSTLGPLVPGRGVPLLFNSVHEGGQNLALGAWVVLCTTTLNKHRNWKAVLSLVSVVGLIAFAAAEGRGMRTGMAAGILVILPLSLSPAGAPYFNTRLIKFMAVGIPLAAMVLIAFPERVAKMANFDRFAQATEADQGEGTAGWRLIWWKNLYAEVMKTNPTFGIGFGEGLSVYHPALAKLDDPFMARSPHNINVTIFTRMGIAGLFVWLCIFFTGVAGLFRRIWNGGSGQNRYSPEKRDELVFWTLMLVATVVNSSFGVLMEGPVLGIWFWFALGFASARSLSPETPTTPTTKADFRKRYSFAN